MKISQIPNYLGLSIPKDEERQVPKIDVENLPKREVLMSWEGSPTMSTKPLDTKFNRTFTIIAIVVALLLVIMQEFALIIVVASVIFFTQALSRHVPEKLRFEISNHGFSYGDKLYYWPELRRFFFIEGGEEILAIDTRSVLPGRLFVNFPIEDRAKIKDYMEEYLHYMEKAPQTILDTAYDKIKDKFDFEQK